MPANNNNNMNMNMNMNMAPAPQPKMDMTSPMQEMPMQDDNMQPYAFYPEIYMIISPYVNMVGDQMDANGMGMPSQQMIEDISDGICDDICRRHPDIAEYVREYEDQNRNQPGEMERAVIEPYFYGGGYDRFRRSYRRRGLFRNLVDILLLSDIYRRRRRYDPYGPYGYNY